MAGRYGREFVGRRFDKATAKNEAARDRNKAGIKDAPKPIRTAPHTGDPAQFDWLRCECGYQRPTSGGKPVPQRLDPAYANWTENSTTTGKQLLHKKVRELALDVYRVGYHHNVIPLGTDRGYPDLTLWGPAGPKIKFREEKSMTGRLEYGQAEHLLSLYEAGFDVAVWKPCCYLSGLIDIELAELAGVPPQGRGAQRLRGHLSRPMTWQDVAGGALDQA